MGNVVNVNAFIIVSFIATVATISIMIRIEPLFIIYHIIIPLVF